MSCPAVIDVLVTSGPIVVDVVTPGPPGAIGSRWFTGASVPAADLGAVGDYYLRVNGDVYGPKASGWGAVQYTLTGTGGGASLSDSTPQPLGTAAAGTAATASRSDHRHAMPTAADVGADAVGTAVAAVAAHAAAADPHPTYTTGAELASALAGKVDSGDPRLSDAREWSAPTVDQATAEAGVSTARVAYNPLRMFQSIAAWWAASAANTKLDGIAAGATANSSDATLLARANHTGTQAVDTISGLGTLATQSGTFSGTSSGSNTGDQDLSGLLTSAAAATTYQPLDSDLSSIATLATAPAGRSLLTLAVVPNGALVGTTDAQTLSGKTFANIKETVFTITDAAGFAIDPANGPIQIVTLGANRTPVSTNWSAGQSMTLLVNDGDGFSITWTSVGTFTNGASAPGLAPVGYTAFELVQYVSTVNIAYGGTYS